MAEYEWPDDPEFRRVAARIADAVTVAINSGVKLGPAYSSDGSVTTRCPIGCMTLVSDPAVTHPSGGNGAKLLGISPSEAWQFMHGFDHDFGAADGQSALYRLGRAYRERFVR